MILPDFLVIGAAKAGTVSLYHYLSQHPKIYMSPINETNFFALHGVDLSNAFNGPKDRETVTQHCVTTLPAYTKLFSQATAKQKIGESSPLYLYSNSAPAQIKQHIPQVKLIAVLRQPTERAFSNYRHYQRAGLEPIDNFAQALAAESDRIAQGWGPWPFWHYMRLGFYAEQLSRYYALFDRSQILVCLHDDLVSNPIGLLQRIFSFIEVDATFIPNVAVRHNIGGKPRNQHLYKLMTRPNPIKRLFNSIMPTALRRRLRDTVHDINLVTPKLDPFIRAELNQTYLADILKLQKMIDRDLTHWIN